MFIPRQFEKFTNYNGYICDKRAGAKEIEMSRLLKFIVKMQEKFKNPYIRFMWTTKDGVDEALCVMYSDFKKNERATKLVPFSEVEQLIMEDWNLEVFRKEV